MNYDQCHACRCLVQRLHPAMDRHGIVLRTCKLNSTIYMAFNLCYHPCRMHELWSMPCLPMSGAGTASSHGQTRHSTSYLKNSIIYMTFDLCYHPCRMHEFGQYCVCRYLVQRWHPAMGRHGIVLMLVGWALQPTCRIMHAAYKEWVNTVLAYVWCILLWRHNGRDGV